MIDRSIYKLITASKKSLILLGPRQVGKTTLIKTLKPDWSINLSDESLYQTYLKDPALLKRQVLLRSEKNKGPYTIAIDEVQRIPSLLNSVQALIDDHPKLRFYLTGSSARKLRRGEANLLPGRVIYRQLFPITYWEILASGLHFDLETSLRLGLLPEVVQNQDQETDSIELLKSYSEIYLREEIQAEALTRDLGGYARFLDLAAELSGHYLNYSKVANDTEINKETIRRYYQILEDTLLIHRIAPFKATKGTRRVRQSDRFIFFDLGVRNSLLRKLNSSFTATELGPLFEQWILQQVMAYSSYQQKDWRISAFRDELGNEVDLVIETDREILAVEIKYQSKYRTDFGSGLYEFKKLLKGTKKLKSYIIYIGDSAQRTETGVHVLPYQDFLSEVIPALD